jgi:hypothetical protein
MVHHKVVKKHDKVLRKGSAQHNHLKLLQEQHTAQALPFWA